MDKREFVEKAISVISNENQVIYLSKSKDRIGEYDRNTKLINELKNILTIINEEESGNEIEDEFVRHKKFFYKKEPENKNKEEQIEIEKKEIKNKRIPEEVIKGVWC